MFPVERTLNRDTIIQSKMGLPRRGNPTLDDGLRLSYFLPVSSAASGPAS